MKHYLFYAKRIYSIRNDDWIMDINLIQNDKEYNLLNGIPIRLNEPDKELLSNPSDMEKGFHECIDGIESMYHFEQLFGYALKNDAIELVNDVFRFDFWSLKLFDDENNVVYSRLSSDINELIDAATPMILSTSNCKIKIACSVGIMDEEGEIEYKDEEIIFNNIDLAPMKSKQVLSIMDGFRVKPKYSDREEFIETVSKSGNSLTIKVTEPCKRMGVHIGEDLNVTLTKDKKIKRVELRMFNTHYWESTIDREMVEHVDSSDWTVFDKFIEHFQVDGIVTHGTQYDFGVSSKQRVWLMSSLDHTNVFHTKHGYNILVAQPYKKSYDKRRTEDWALEHNCEIKEYPEYSWYRPETTLIVISQNKLP